MATLAPIKRAKFEKFLIFIGCAFKRSKGDHLIYDRADLLRPVVITTDREVPLFIIRSNLKTLGLSAEEFLEILVFTLTGVEGKEIRNLARGAAQALL